MWLLVIQFRGITNPVVFKFKALKPAKDWFEMIANGMEDSGYTKLFDVQDDFGHRRAFHPHSVEHPAMLDLAQDIEGNAEVQLWNTRGQVAAQRKVQSDPALKFAAAVQGGIQLPPGMLHQ